MKAFLLILISLLACFFYGCINSTPRVIDYKDSKGRITKHIVVLYYLSNDENDTLTDYKDTNGRTMKEVDIGHFVKDENIYDTVREVSITTRYFDTLGRIKITKDTIFRYR
jgi:hypothetical protein